MRVLVTVLLVCWHAETAAGEYNIADVDDDPASISVDVGLMQLDINMQRARRNNTFSNASAVLPSVDCVRVISLEGSEQLPLLEAELDRLGLRDRAVFQTETPDPEGGQAGCFRAHVRAWNAGREAGCSSLLVLEDDAFFDPDVEQQGLSRADAYLKTGLPFDLLLLGWNKMVGIGRVSVQKIDGSECAFNLIGDWASTHAYVISPAATEKWKNLEWREGRALDVYVADQENSTFVTVRPVTAYQRYHKTEIPWEGAPPLTQDLYARKKAKPAVQRSTEDQIYEQSSYGDECVA